MFRVVHHPPRTSRRKAEDRRNIRPLHDRPDFRLWQSMALSLVRTELEGKTVLQVLSALEAGGAELGTLDISAALRDAGARVLVASSGGRMAAGLGADHVRLPVDTKNPIGLWRNSGRLETLIAREGVGLVHAHSRAPAWSARVAARRRGGAIRYDRPRCLQLRERRQTRLQPHQGA